MQFNWQQGGYAPPELFIVVDSSLKKMIDDIAQYGCHVVNEIGDECRPRYSYSIGIEETSKNPEIIITGLKTNLSNWIIGEYNRRVRNGETFEPHTRYAGFLEDFDVILKPVVRDHYEEYLALGRSFYGGNNFRVFQLIYPAMSGIWPWDEAATGDYKYFVPLLCTD